MRIGVVGVAVIFAAQAVAGWAQSARENKAETVARWHFAGTKQLSEAKNIETLSQVLALPQSTALRNAGLNGFAQRVAQRFTRGNDTNLNNRVAGLIRPLLNDLVENENSFELTARGAQDADWALAVKLPGERVAEWSKNLNALAASSKMQVSSPDNAGSWTAHRDDYRLNFSPEKEWLVLEGGFGPNPGGKRGKNLLRRLGKDVLTAELNLPKIGAMWNAEWLQHGPRLDLTVTPRRGLLRSEMEIEYPENLNIKPERWKVPADLIHDPLIGFTALQGISDRLSHAERFREAGAQKAPNQVFLWSQGIAPFTVFAAADVGNPVTVISNVAHGYLPKVKQTNGRFVLATNRPAILWRGLPAVVPFLEAADNGR